MMKKCGLVVILVMLYIAANVNVAAAQCSICTKTASQLGDKPARGLNTGIIYLMLTPFAIVGYVGYKWWQGEKANNS